MDGSRATGALGDLGSHMFDFTRWLLGEVQGVGARLTQAVDRSAFEGEPTNDNAAVSLMVEGGILVQVHVSLAVAYGDAVVRLRTEFHGDQGTLEAQHDFLGTTAGVRIRGCRRGEKFQDLADPARSSGRHRPGRHFLTVSAPFGRPSALRRFDHRG